MTDDQIRSRNRAVIEASMGSVHGADIDGQLGHCTDDYVLELPYADPPKRIEGKEVVRAYLAQALGIFKISLTLNEIYECTDPNRLVLEYTSTGSVTTTGKPYANRYIAVVEFRDGQIALQREFYNPLVAVRSLSPD